MWGTGQVHSHNPICWDCNGGKVTVEQRDKIDAYSSWAHHDPNQARALAEFFHETYETLAPSFGYTTRPDTRALDFNSPNGQLMAAVCGEVLRHLWR